MTRPNHGGNLNWAASIANCPTSLILDFSASINPLGPPLSVIQAIQDHIYSVKAYPDPAYPELTKALARWHQLPPEYILPGNGSAELLTWAAWELSHLDLTHIMTPAFSDYLRAAKTFNIKLNACPLDVKTGKWKVEANPALTQGLILNNPHNPSGRLLQREQILPYLEAFALVVVDEAFMDFLPSSEEQSLINVVTDYPNLVILRSLTKFYSLPGLRIGYAIAHPDRLRRWQLWRDPWPINTLAVHAAMAAIEDKIFAQKTLLWLKPTREEVFSSLQTLTPFYPLPSCANFLLVHTSIPGSSLQEILLKEYQILIRDCLSFPELGENYFRIAILSKENNQKLLTALTQVVADDRRI
ncbi:threonine-phosphate decarboxylase CobD [Gloeocapsa sp. PCC 73106]|uniref:threonine-phosphate decarboxylase CobD n=1 Tax=Gloeocapsa sp. PCC 73106 TaxID=102232 RepID=UPI0002ABFB2B|nr:threonine-phosphate decarboxylase CobD [Gloeocapsa sp. PCC 73106]ELR96485.1 L-threonine O-3-phosphate decarboxylase [Gloeocapsa sp. PCC 73106]